MKQGSMKRSQRIVTNGILSYAWERILEGKNFLLALASKPREFMLPSRRRKLNKLSRRNIFRANLGGNLELLEGRALMATLAAWDFTGEGTTTNATSTADTVGANLDFGGTLTRGAGAAYSSGGNSFRTQGFQNNGISTNNTDFFQTTLSASPGFTLSLNTIDARFAGTATFANSPGVSSQFAYSLDGSTFTLIGSPSVTTGTPATLAQVNLSGISALQNVPAATTVTFRYYASGQTTSGGWGFNSPTSGTHGLTFDGTVDSAGPVAPIVTTPTSASITTSSAVLGGNITSDGGSAILESGVIYAPSTPAPTLTLAGTGTVVSTGPTTTGVFTLPAITGLSSSTAYSFVAYATNDQGTTYSSIGTFTTSGAPVVPTVTGSPATAIGSTTATLNGNVGSDGNSAISARGFLYAPSTPSPDLVIGGSGVTNVPVSGTTGAMTSNLTGLTAGLGYSYVAYATNGVGTTYSTPVTTFTTLSVPTISTPTQTGVTGTGATLGGNITATGGSAITERGIVYALTAVNSAPVIAGTGVIKVAATLGQTGVFTATASGLTGLSGYTYAAYATNSVGTSYTTYDSFTTLTAPSGWDFGTTDNATTAPPISSPTNTTFSNLTRGNPNFGTTDALIRTNSASTTSNYASATGGGNATVAAVGGALNTASSAYFQFTVTPNSGFQTALTGISFGSRSTGTGPLGYAIRSSADSFASDLGTGTLVANSTYALQILTLTSTTSTNAAPLTYRIYAFGGTAAIATANQGANWRIDDLLLTSTTTPFVPANPTLTVTASNAVYTGVAYAGANVSVTGAGTPAPTSSFTYYTGTGVVPENVLSSAPINVGTYTVIATSPANGGNNAATSNAVTFDITQAPLTIADVSGVDKTYDGTAAATLSGSPTYSGLVNGETFTVGGSPTFAFPSVDANATAYTLTQTGSYTAPSSGNYSLTQPTFTAKINKATATVTVNGFTGVYDGSPKGATGSATGVGGADLSGSLSLGSSFTNVPGGTASWTFSGGTNYNDASGSVAIVITPATLTVTGITGESRVYNGNAIAAVNGTPSLSGVLNTDNVDLSTSVTYAFANKNVGNAKPITITGLSISGSQAGNYTLVQPSLTADITPLAITGDVDVADKVFDGTTTATIVTRILTGVISGDTVTYVGGTANFASSAVGNNIVVTATGLSLSGADAGNYTVNDSATTTANITPSAAAPTFDLATVNGGDSFLNPAQRSQLTSFVMKFSAPVIVAANAFTVANVGLITAQSAAALASSQILVTGSGTDTITLRWGAGAGVVSRSGSGATGNSLADGNWQLSIDSSKVTSVSGGVAMTGNNVFGTASTDKFFRMFGDSDGNGQVNSIDTAAFSRALATYNAAMDFDGNGSVLNSGVDRTNFLGSFTTYSGKRRRTF